MVEGRHRGPGSLQRGWNTFRTYVERQRQSFLQNEIKRKEERQIGVERQRLQSLPLPEYSGKEINEIPTFALSKKEIKHLQENDRVYKLRLIEATIALQTANPDEIGAIISKIPFVDPSQLVNTRPFFDQYAFSDNEVVSLRNLVAKQLEQNSTERTTPPLCNITFITDRSDPTKPVWELPLIRIY